MPKDYTVSFSSATPSLTPVDATNSKSYSIGGGTGEIYIGVPAGTVNKGSVFIYQNSSKDILGSRTTGSANTIESNMIYTLGAIEANSTVPQGMLSKAFSVSATKKVYFSNGNLQAACTKEGAPGTSTYSWAFAENQYSRVAAAAGNTSIDNQTLNSKVDLFGWVGASSTVLTDAATKYGISTSQTSADYGNRTSDVLKEDWGTTIDNNGTWRTLSSAEWTYLLNTTNAESGARTDANRFAKAKVNSVNGLIIFPDGYTTVPSDAGIADVNKTDATFPETSIASETWTSMESAGCVFLPLAGFRNGSTTEYVDGYGCYWSSTPNASNAGQANDMQFSEGKVTIVNNGNRYSGLSVRLVTNAN